MQNARFNNVDTDALNRVQELAKRINNFTVGEIDTLSQGKILDINTALKNAEQELDKIDMLVSFARDYYQTGHSE